MTPAASATLAARRLPDRHAGSPRSACTAERACLRRKFAALGVARHVRSEDAMTIKDPRSWHHPLVLVVEPDPAESARIEAHLKAHGVLACPVRRGDDALSLARSFRFALAIIRGEPLDMPAAELATRLRALDAAPAVVPPSAKGDGADLFESWKEIAHVR
jgi:hypothetical protein